MPAPYITEHWNVFFRSTTYCSRWNWFPPAEWAVKHDLDEITDNLPNGILNRTAVRNICRSNEYSVLYGYLCAMAWGSQGAGPFGSRYVKSAWVKQELLGQHLERLCAGGLSRSAPYNLFIGDDNAASPNNKCGNYQAYCEEIDAMAALLGLPGADIEEMLMSKEGRAPWG
jgi:hypothetical protein